MILCCINFSIAPFTVPEMPRTFMETQPLPTRFMQARAALVSDVLSFWQRSIPEPASYDISEGFISLIPLSPNIEYIESSNSSVRSLRVMVFSENILKAIYRFFSRSTGSVFILFQYLPVRTQCFFFASCQG